MKIKNRPIYAIAIFGMALAGLIGSQSVAAAPALTPFNFKVKECKVDTSPDPVSCKSVKKMLKDLETDGFTLELRHDGPTGMVFFLRNTNSPG